MYCPSCGSAYAEMLTLQRWGNCFRCFHCGASGLIRLVSESCAVQAPLPDLSVRADPVRFDRPVPFVGIDPAVGKDWTSIHVKGVTSVKNETTGEWDTVLHCGPEPKPPTKPESWRDRPPLL